MRRLYMFTGLLFMLMGGFLILMIYGFSSMIDPNVEGDSANAAVFHNIAVHKGEIAFGTILFCMGLWLAVQKPKNGEQ